MPKEGLSYLWELVSPQGSSLKCPAIPNNVGSSFCGLCILLFEHDSYNGQEARSIFKTLATNTAVQPVVASIMIYRIRCVVQWPGTLFPTFLTCIYGYPAFPVAHFLDLSTAPCVFTKVLPLSWPCFGATGSP